jgi:hypothetical protein
MTKRVALLSLSMTLSIPPRRSVPASALTRPRMQSSSTRGCSITSLSMKCLKPFFSICVNDISSSLMLRERECRPRIDDAAAAPPSPSMEASLRCPRESVDDARSSNESSLASSVALPSSSCPRLSLYEARVAFQLERWNGLERVRTGVRSSV